MLVCIIYGVSLYVILSGTISTNCMLNRTSNQLIQSVPALRNPGLFKNINSLDRCIYTKCYSLSHCTLYELPKAAFCLGCARQRCDSIKRVPVNTTFTNPFNSSSGRIRYLTMTGPSSDSNSMDSDDSYLIDAALYRNGVNAPEDIKLQIRISKQEKVLFDLLKECVDSNNLNIDLRVAGGWVRDKLLNQTSKDIDIALEHITGVDFCNYLNAFTEKSYGFHKTVGVVKRRPEQSKHLETATINIMGLNIDFVNLRSEDYAQNSRIPIMKIGTPFEDAMRRDFTINALFYNISKNAIEDYTGKGIDDLNAEVIRTCSPAFGTFLDDPLRVIRAARFAARLGYALDSDIIKSGSDPEVLAQLSQKVAKARIAQELDDMLIKGDTALAFEIMKTFGVLPILVRDVPGDAPSDSQIDTGCQTMAWMKQCLAELKWDDVDRRILYIAAFCVPLKDEPQVDKCSYTEHVIKSRLKMPNKLASGATTVIEGSEMFLKAINKLPPANPDLRELLGGMIRSIGPLWKEALILCMTRESFDVDPRELAGKYNTTRDMVYSLDIHESYNLKAPITGKELMEVLPTLSRGPKFKEVLDFQIKHILRQPDMSNDEILNLIVKHFKN